MSDYKSQYRSGDVRRRYVIIHDVAHLLPYWWTKEFPRPTTADLFTTPAEAERAVSRFTRCAIAGQRSRKDALLAGGKRMPNHIRRRMEEAGRYLDARS